MIRRDIQPEEHADFGPVRLVSTNGPAWVRPGQPVAMVQHEGFPTVKMALDRAKKRLGQPDFVMPFISSDETGRPIWQQLQIEQYATDPLTFAAQIAMVLPGDLRSGPVHLHSGVGRILARDFATLREAIEAAAAVKDEGPFILAPDGAEALVLPDALAVVIGYL